MGNLHDNISKEFILDSEAVIFFNVDKINVPTLKY